MGLGRFVTAFWRARRTALTAAWAAVATPPLGGRHADLVGIGLDAELLTSTRRS
jgi:hypothetical protein